MISLPSVTSIIVVNFALCGLVLLCSRVVSFDSFPGYLFLSFGAHCCEAKYSNTCIKYYTMWKKIWDPKHTCCDLVNRQLYIELLGCWRFACNAVLCWNALTLEWNSAPISDSRSPFALEMCFPTVQQTQQCA
jgi:hypothetical protein